MAITYRTVTGNLADLLRTGFDPSTVRITVRTNLDSGDAPIDLTNGQILLGTGRVTVASDGTFSTTNVIDHASTDVNPTGIQYRWDIDYTPRNGQRVTSWTSGFINVTADADLSTLVATQYVPPSYQNAFIAEAEAIRDDIVDLSAIAVPDALVEALVKNTGGAGPLTSAALTATIDQQVPAASTTTQGKVELATTAEVVTGTDSTRSVTPQGALAALFANFNAAGGFLNVKNEGVKGDWRSQGGAAIAIGSTDLTVAGYTFTAADVGKIIVLQNAATLNETTQPRNYASVPGAGPQPGNLLWTTIVGFNPANGHATIANAATRLVTNDQAWWGTDDTAALNAAFAKAATYGAGGGDLRMVFIPQGWYRYSQLVIPKGIRVFGVNWGWGYGNATGPSASKNNGTFLQQIEGANCDSVVFTHSLYDGDNYWVGPCEIRDIVFQGPYTGTIGSGIKAASITNIEAGAIVSEGFFLDNVQVVGFAEHGVEFPQGASTLFTRGLRPYFNGGAGVYFAAPSGAAQSVHFLDTSGDGNGAGLFYFDSLNGGGTKECVVTLTNSKSEAAGWDTLFTPTSIRRAETGKQLSPLIINSCKNTFVINGFAHLSAAKDRTTDPTGATFYSPGPVITLTGTGRPYIAWAGVGVRDMTSIRTETHTADMVLLRDTGGIDIPISVTDGSYQGRGAGGGWGNKGTPHADYGEPGSRHLVSLDPGAGTVLPTFKTSVINERPWDQLSGPTPSRSWYENDGTAQAKHWHLTASGGEFALHAVDDDGAATAKLIKATRDTSKNATVSLGGAGASDKLGFHGATGAIKQSVSGSRLGGGAASSLIAALAAYNLVGDATTAGIASWAASTAVAAYDLIRLPTGGLGYQTAARTTRASWDATERDFWTFLPGGHQETISAGTTTWKAALGVTKIICLDLLAGGAGGNGGGSATAAVNQTGGPGGAPGERVVLRALAVTPGNSYTCAVGAGGSGGSGGAAAGNNAGGLGTAGGQTTFTISSTTYKAGGGNIGAAPAGNSTGAANPGSAGGNQWTAVGAGIPGTGGPATSTFGQPPAPLAGVIGGSAGGPASSATSRGGLGGTARTSVAGTVNSVSAGGSADGNGGAGTAATELGCGGGGGGGGCASGAGGAGGAGAAGVIQIEF